MRTMRTEFIGCKTRRTAILKMWWASKIVKVEGGYRGFEYVEDFETWKRQNAGGETKC